MPRHSTIAAYLALFASLSTGGAFAATTLAPNSVGSAQIRHGSIRLSDVSPATIRELKGKRGPTGAAGAAGLNGDAGASGATASVVIRKLVQDAAHGIPAGQSAGLGVSCAAGEQIIGGGAVLLVNGAQQFGSVQSSYPTTQPDGTGEWITTIGNRHETDAGIASGYAVCLKAGA